MLKSYFTTAWRNLVHNKTYSALNILGLAIGMTVALIIGLWVYYQYSYDRFLPGYQQAHMVRTRMNRNGDVQQMPATTMPLADVLKKEIPEIRYAAHARWNDMHGLMIGDKKIYDVGLVAGDDFLKIFQFPFAKGDLHTAFPDPYSVVLTRSVAVALFGEEDPMGKMVRFDNQDNLKVTGVLEDLPRNASFQFKFIVPFSYAELHSKFIKRASTSWNINAFATYVALQPGVTEAQVAPKLREIIKKYTRSSPGAIRNSGSGWWAS